MKKFSVFLNESTISAINVELKQLDIDSLVELYDYLIDVYFDFDDVEDNSDVSYDELPYNDEYTADDVIIDIMNLLELLDDDELISILDDLSYIDDMSENISMKVKHRNTQRRKYMTKTSADLRKDKIQRDKNNRANKSARKQYYKQNKVKIKAYKKDYNDKVKKGLHIVKKRKTS